jgi:hypothetical protein
VGAAGTPANASSARALEAARFSRERAQFLQTSIDLLADIVE